MGVDVSANNDVLQPSYYRVSAPQSSQPRDRDVDILWPRSSFQGGLGPNNPLVLDSAHQAWEWDFPPTGVHVRKKITGISKDSTGAVLGGATVQLFNTATGLLVDTVVSDSAGNYTVSDPNGVACFAVAYKAGSPDLGGTTLNTLTGI